MESRTAEEDKRKPNGRDRRVSASRRSSSNSGFAIAPILYVLGLVGIGAGILFSSYSQILRSNV